ncbi:Integrase core domain protein [Planctomycetes bacterium CA13]|uniref:Integrase core domain protein n=1 Tax=Novipirellula herctigrandis TaxID=2527986 RepID=A0A5C5ZB49_9BACT|nr:Integrase core domain protein [Planctomycetes bacterium CA13]
MVVNRWDYSDRKEKKYGRPTVRQVIVDLTVKFAKENPTWGYDRISGALSDLGYNICDSTIGNILKAHGFEPAPDRKRTGSWETFLQAYWDVMAASDFTTVEVWTKKGLTTYYLLFGMELKTRRVHFAGCTTNPNQAWMKTIALELTNHEDGFFKDKKYLIMDRDATFSQSFRDFLRNEGVKPVRLPPRSPNLNAHLERFFGSLKSECLYKRILFAENPTRKAVRSFLEYYHTERNHQGLNNELIVTIYRPPDMHAEIETTKRLGGLLRSYRRVA